MIRTITTMDEHLAQLNKRLPIEEQIIRCYEVPFCKQSEKVRQEINRLFGQRDD